MGSVYVQVDVSALLSGLRLDSAIDVAVRCSWAVSQEKMRNTKLGACKGVQSLKVNSPFLIFKTETLK